MITQVLLPLALAFIMFAMGLTMTLKDFKMVFTHPRAILTGLGCKLLLVPALGFLVIVGFGMNQHFAVGMLILAACPAGVTSSLLTHHAGGRIALAAGVTALSSLAAAITLPVITNFGLRFFADYEAFVDLPVGKMVLGIFLVDTLPLAFGLGLQQACPLFAAKLGRIARPLATFLFAVIVAGAFIGQFQTMIEHAEQLLPAALALNVAAMLVAGVFAYAAGLNAPERIAVVMENGLQNSALGIFVAATLLNNNEMMVPSIIYALAMNVTALLMIAALRLAKQPARSKA
ncbi:MAG: bile acid:sodium symporter family protein [Alphaproteobacteria bacterium]|nr:bile acid:sodium symporter family protein [Alphaproteobacteria bacterium]